VDGAANAAADEEEEVDLVMVASSSIGEPFLANAT
jgi:hypothetical protein